MAERGESAQARGCLESHYGRLSEFSAIIILMTLMNLQFGAWCSDVPAAVCLRGPSVLESWFGSALF